MTASLSADTVENLSLSSTIRKALRGNPEIESEAINVEINRAQVVREVSEFGWSLEAVARYEDRDKPQNTREFIAVGGISLPGNNSRIFSDRNYTSRFGFKKNYTTGTTLELGSRFSRLKNTLNQTSTSALFSPEFETFSGITITQPLLKGGSRKANLAATNIARNRVTASELLLKVKAMNLAAEVASRYTDVVATEQALKSRKENILLAEGMLKRNKELLKSGEGVETDVTTAELALYQRQDDYIGAAAEKIERLNNLFTLMNRGPDLEGKIRFQTISGFFDESKLGDKKKLIDNARSNRLDIQYYERVVETAKLNVLRAKDASKATLNLTGTAGVYGLSDNESNAFTQARSTQGKEWSLGLNFKMSLSDDGPEAGIRVAEGQLRQAELEKRKAEGVIALEVDTAYSRVTSARQRIKTAEKAVELATKRLSQEEQLNLEGTGDFYRVVEQQQILGDAQINLIAAHALLSKSIIATWLASGQIFDRLGLSSGEIEMLIYRSTKVTEEKVTVAE